MSLMVICTTSSRSGTGFASAGHGSRYTTVGDAVTESKCKVNDARERSTFCKEISNSWNTISADPPTTMQPRATTAILRRALGCRAGVFLACLADWRLFQLEWYCLIRCKASRNNSRMSVTIEILSFDMHKRIVVCSLTQYQSRIRTTFTPQVYFCPDSVSGQYRQVELNASAASKRHSILSSQITKS